MSEPLQLPGGPLPSSAVATVATDLADVIEGYKTMAERADASLRPQIEQLLNLHETHAGGLFEVMQRLGDRPDEAGSINGQVQRAAVIAQGWFTDIGQEALVTITDGENRLIDSYSDAIADTRDHPEINRLLERQRDEIETRIDALAP